MDKSFATIESLAHWIAKRQPAWGIYLDHYLRDINENDIVSKMKNVIDILFDAKFDLYNKLKFNNIKLDKFYEGCTAGEKLITISVDGLVYPCQTVINREPICELNDNLLENLKCQKCYKIGYNYTLPPECVNCSIAEYCGGGCKINNTEINKNNSCVVLKRVLEHLTGKIMQQFDK